MRNLVLCAAIAASGAGCATIMSGHPAVVPVATNPPGAQVFLDGQLVGQTPTTVVIPNQSLGNIHIEAPGFMPIDLRRYKGINGWFWANICWGILPMIVDAVTGYYETFDDTPIAIGMTPGQGGGYPQGGEQQPPDGYQQPQQPQYPQQPQQPQQPPPGY